MKPAVGPAVPGPERPSLVPPPSPPWGPNRSTQNQEETPMCPINSRSPVMEKQPASFSPDVPFRALLPFFVLTFGLAWGLIGLLVASPPVMERLFGPASASHPLFILAVWTPALVALPLVRLTAGRGALGRYLSRLMVWKAPVGWYAFLLLGIPALFFGGAALAGRIPGGLEYPGGAALVQTMALMVVLGPVEEFGWRGLALPLLQRRLAPLWAGILLGVVWGVWHLPAFFLSGTPQGSWDFVPFFLGTTAVSVILTALFNSSRGSILLAALFHYQLINPLWPDAQPYDMYLFAMAAVGLAWVHRDTLLDRRAGFTEVAPRSRRDGVAADGGRDGSRSQQLDTTTAGATGAGVT